MELSSAQKNVGKIAASLGILQGVAWSFLSLIAITLYNWSPNIKDSTNSTTYPEFLNALIYYHFIAESSSNSTTANFVIRPFDFTIFMWFYFLLSTGWIAVSADQFTAIHYNKRRKTIVMIMWSIITLIISLIDLILVCLLARDYATCSSVSDEIEMQLHCYLRLGIIMSVVARGFTLWVANLIFSVIILIFTTKGVKDDKDLYGPLYIPRAKLPKSQTTNSFPEKEESTEGSLSNIPSSFFNRHDNLCY